MYIKTEDPKSIKPFLDKLYIPPKNSHKGQNGKTLVIGGSNLFHSASIWAAEIASHFVDMVFYSSVPENNKIVEESKKKFSNGIVINREDLKSYIEEANSILIGPGMVRGEAKNFQFSIFNLQNVLKIEDEPSLTYYLTKYLLESYPAKKFVIDAGALQMMEKEWLDKLSVPAIVTPHQQEFQRLFGLDITQLGIDKKITEVKEHAKKYSCVIHLKAIDDIISDGSQTIVVQGGNQGLTKGGTGDLLAGLTNALYAKNEALTSASMASYLLKKAADNLYKTHGYWYNIDNLIDEIPKVLSRSHFV